MSLMPFVGFVIGLYYLKEPDRGTEMHDIVSEKNSMGTRGTAKKWIEDAICHEKHIFAAGLPSPMPMRETSRTVWSWSKFCFTGLSSRG